MPLTHDEIQRLDWKTILSPYWSLTWRTFVLILAVSLVGVLISKLTGSPLITLLMMLVGIGAIIVFTIDIFRKVFTESFRDFRIAIISRDTEEEIELVNPQFMFQI